MIGAKIRNNTLSMSHKFSLAAVFSVDLSILPKSFIRTSSHAVKFGAKNETTFDAVATQHT